MPSRTPFAHVLHAEAIEQLANGSAIARGRAYADQGRVRALARRGGRLVGSVQGGDVYAIRIWAKGGGLGYACSCPAGLEGHFCKHCVAVAYAWLRRAPKPPG